jgi:hypothetical protein
MACLYLHAFILMKRVVKERQVEINNKLLALPYSKAGKGHYLEILQRIVEQLDVMLEYHCKLLIFRVDLHLHDEVDTSEQLSRFFRRFKKGLKGLGHIRVGYIWCREQDNASKPHYHLAVIVNGNINQNPHYLVETVRHYWTDWQVGTVWQPSKSFYRLPRGDLCIYQEVFDRLSYLAKVDTKGNKPKPANDYGGSRLKSKRV